jgi:hypothetical protein
MKSQSVIDAPRPDTITVRRNLVQCIAPPRRAL